MSFPIRFVRAARTRLAALLHTAFPSHKWEHDADRTSRHCSICKRTEEVEPGCGFDGSMWLVVEKGEPGAHAA